MCKTLTDLCIRSARVQHFSAFIILVTGHTLYPLTNGGCMVVMKVFVIMTDYFLWGVVVGGVRLVKTFWEFTAVTSNCPNCNTDQSR